jgi:hypothetical protein
MADWRQIQARIRRAKAGSDPSRQLADLYEKTRDAMVAFELGRVHEKAARMTRQCGGTQSPWNGFAAPNGKPKQKRR